jgi:hypothetical protein
MDMFVNGQVIEYCDQYHEDLVALLLGHKQIDSKFDTSLPLKLHDDSPLQARVLVSLYDLLKLLTCLNEYKDVDEPQQQIPFDKITALCERKLKIFLSLDFSVLGNVSHFVCLLYHPHTLGFILCGYQNWSVLNVLSIILLKY